MRIPTGSPAVAKRVEELKVPFVYLGRTKKMQAFEECIENAGIIEQDVAYMGDDLPDIPLAQRAVLAISLADGADEFCAASGRDRFCVGRRARYFTTSGAPHSRI